MTSETPPLLTHRPVWASGALVVGALLAALLVAALTAASAAAQYSFKQNTVLDNCQPAWNPSDTRIKTYDDKSLHSESESVKQMFWQTWQLPYLQTPDEPSLAELRAGLHLRRWRWEYECKNPRVVVTDTDLVRRSIPARAGSATCPEVSGTINDEGWHCHGAHGEIQHEHGDSPGSHDHRTPTRIPRQAACTVSEVTTREGESAVIAGLKWHCHGNHTFHQHGLMPGESLRNHRH